MNIKKYVFPEKTDEAYELLINEKSSLVIGGGAYLRLQKTNIETAVDIEKLEFNYIKCDEHILKIGSSVTLRELEVNVNTKTELNEILSNMVKQIGGVQLRNLATIGGSICGKYNFSDILPSLVALNAKLVFFKYGEIELKEYLEKETFKDILIEIVIDIKQEAIVKYFKSTYKEYSLINLAIAKKDNVYKIAVGGRPGRAKISELGSMVLSTGGNIDKAIEVVLNELEFKKDYRASDEYRKNLTKVLLKEAFNEMWVK